MGTFTERNFEVSLSFGNIRDEDDFFDVTLAADTLNGSIEALRAHKLILSAASPVLRSLLREQSRLSGSSQGMPLMLYLRDISARGLGHVLDFLYRGSISLAEEELEDFLAVSESLQVSFMERFSHGPTKRALTPSNIKMVKKARFDPQTEQGLLESGQTSLVDYFSVDTTIKTDLEISQSDEELHEEDISPDLYEENMDSEDSKEKTVDETTVQPDVKLEIKHDNAKNIRDPDRERGKRNVKEYLVAEILEGKKRGSKSYMIRNKLVLQDIIYKNTILASCHKKHKGCRGRAKLCKDTLMVLYETAHTCNTDETDIAILNLENKMKNRAENETSLSLRQIFDEVSSENPEVAARISFPRIEAVMSKRRTRARKAQIPGERLN